ncbi:M56 family metallopeptidase [Fibrella forsythiae]|uniref:TonB family protein n=1 Tax=Fibrella forsythiae TaxID=2817061 RepID=A0ABS3JHU7_9BACT|nr:M56 family metallopeptidase [Fibrella forsythiae]MBO0948991.1 TonB family protein [Fibrella forsythiae]
MTPLVDHWLKANLFLILFYGCYALLLRRHTFLTLNRTYLMGSLALAFLLPLVHIPGLSFPWPWEETNVPVYTAVTIDTISVAGLTTETEAPLLPDWPVLAGLAFALVAVGLLVRTAWRTVSLLRFIRQWPSHSMGDHTLVLPDTAQTPTFSFFRYLILNPEDAQTDAVRQHELVHIRQKHSLDVLLLEVVQALCWPNPALFGYRQAIRQVHEYLADRDATKQTTTDRDTYARFLVSYAFHLPADSLAHSFGPNRPDSPTLKQRIQMLYQQHTRRRALWKYALVLPLAATLLAMTNVPEPDTLVKQVRFTDSTSQLTHVQGIVSEQRSTSDDHRPLPGATIVVRNGHKGTTTDSRGTFSIDVPAGTELVASFVGFASQSMVVPAQGGNIVLSFKLKPQAVDGSSMPMTAPPTSLTVPTAPAKSGEVFTVVESPPTFPGGAKALSEFISSNIRYPEEARKQRVQGKVFVNFVVNTDGSIDRINILKGLGKGCDEEAVRVVAIMPKWDPGKQNGHPVAVQYNLPINFSLGDKKVGMNVPSSLLLQMDTVVKNNPKFYYQGNGKEVPVIRTQFNSKINPPLFLLDGEEISQEAMDAIDPNTIQSVDVLKSESATSFYGLKAKNGVVRITTNKGSEIEKKKDR